LRDKIFANLGTNNPKIKSITPKSKIYPEGSIVEFDGEVLHRSGDMIILKWDNNPWGNKVWIGAVNIKHKVAVVSEFYDGVTSFGVSVESLAVCFLINDSVHELIILHRSDWFFVFARA
jgi:hypothetical protein